jgi:hypothetical protein
MGALVSGHLINPRVIQRSGHRTIRIWVKTKRKMGVLRRKLHHVGCQSERGHIEGFLAVDVPPRVDLHALRRWLNDAANACHWRVGRP